MNFLLVILYVALIMLDSNLCNISNRARDIRKMSFIIFNSVTSIFNF